MANQEYVDILKQGADVWNKLRQLHSGILLEFSGARLSGARLNGARLSGVDLSGCYLSGA